MVMFKQKELEVSEEKLILVVDLQDKNGLFLVLNLVHSDTE